MHSLLGPLRTIFYCLAWYKYSTLSPYLLSISLQTSYLVTLSVKLKVKEVVKCKVSCKLFYCFLLVKGMSGTKVKATARVPPPANQPPLKVHAQYATLHLYISTAIKIPQHDITHICTPRQIHPGQQIHPGEFTSLQHEGVRYHIL